MPVVHRTTDLVGRWGDRLLGLLVPHVSAAAAFKVECYCQCQTRCYKLCTEAGQGVFCGRCTICESAPGCGSC
jgi:hypothetical protein